MSARHCCCSQRPRGKQAAKGLARLAGGSARTELDVRELTRTLAPHPLPCADLERSFWRGEVSQESGFGFALSGVLSPTRSALLQEQRQLWDAVGPQGHTPSRRPPPEGPGAGRLLCPSCSRAQSPFGDCSQTNPDSSDPQGCVSFSLVLLNIFERV